MKKIVIKPYLFFGLLILVMNSCKHVVNGINIDPNNPTSAPYPLVLNGAEVASFLVYEGNLARTAGIFSSSLTGADRQYVSLQNYNSSSVDYNDTWDNLYSTVITQAQNVRSQAEAVNDRTTAGIAQVIMAQGFGLAADLWGDVPFSEVGDADKFPTPKFDAQADVYAGVQKLLDSAIDNLASGVGIGPGSKDIFYGGDPGKWLEAAHTLKARFYLHTKDYASALTEAESGISSAADNMMDPHGSSYLIDFNVYYSFLTYDRPAYMTADGSYAAALLDPSSNSYRGNAKTIEESRYYYNFSYYLNTGGLDPNVVSAADGWVADPNYDGFFGTITSFPLVTFEENTLITAEANMKKSTPNPSAALNALNSFRAYMNDGGGYINSGYWNDPQLGALGYTFDIDGNSVQIAHGEYDPYNLVDFSTGGIANTNDESQNDALLREILEERYVTLIGQIEQFNDVRRTKNFLNIPPTTGTTLPQRFLYPQDEINTNPNTPVLAAGDLFKETPVNSTPY